MTETLKVENGDWVLSESTGRFATVSGKDKLRQDGRQNLDTDVQANGTGAGLDRIVGSVGDAFSIRAEMAQDLTQSFEALRSLQDTIQREDRTDDESFSRLTQVIVMPAKDPESKLPSSTVFAFRVDITSRAGDKPISYTGALVR